MVSIAVQAARYLLDHPVDSERLMIERGIGYWISPDGQFVPTPPRVSHADIIREELGDDDRQTFDADVNALAIGVGWSRVRIYPDDRVAYVDFGRDRQRQHAPAVESLIDHLGLVGIIAKFTDEHGNYVSPPTRE
jgi:hypothetical protein